MDSKTKEAIKQLQSEIRVLQTLIETRADERSHSETNGNTPAPPKEKPEKEKGDLGVQIAVRVRPEDADSKPRSVSPARLAQVTDEAAAHLGYALASPQKIGLLRALLDVEMEGAAALGEAVGLSTGSLYHHLRELMRANLIDQAGRSQYRLTETGRRTLLVILALAAEH